MRSSMALALAMLLGALLPSATGLETAGKSGRKLQQVRYPPWAPFPPEAPVSTSVMVPLGIGVLAAAGYVCYKIVTILRAGGGGGFGGASKPRVDIEMGVKGGKKAGKPTVTAEATSGGGNVFNPLFAWRKKKDAGADALLRKVGKVSPGPEAVLELSM
eukprot:XP_001696796.1 predicted protein [Chlamydomonas reinhardtii]